MMDTGELLGRLDPLVKRWRRPAWRPVVEERDGTPADPKFGGTPWLADGEAWPECGSCGAPMPFFMQLDLGALPPELAGRYGTGLLQLFYCTACDEGFEPFSKASLVRIVQPDNGAGDTPATDAEQLPPRAIVGWQVFRDMPSISEHEELGVRYMYDRGSYIRGRVEVAELGIEADDVDTQALGRAIGSAASGDKLAGWPDWVQGVEYPLCPECSQQMQLVFQIDSENNIPFMFGDVGTGHITQCPTHHHIVAFGWACS